MPFADELINGHTAHTLTQAVRTVLPDADPASLRAAAQQLDSLSLRERSDLLRDALLADVPGDYAELARVVRAAHAGVPAFTGWLIWPVTSAIATKAVAEGTDDAFDDAMTLLAALTGRLTSEFAIRVLLRHDVDRALRIIADWTASPDSDVRRLASEGTRPYLPWAIRVPALIARSGVTVPVLDVLYRDESEYVRRSVANHLNDLSRDQADLVVATARGWLADPAPPPDGSYAMDCARSSSAVTPAPLNCSASLRRPSRSADRCSIGSPFRSAGACASPRRSATRGTRRRGCRSTTWCTTTRRTAPRAPRRSNSRPARWPRARRSR
ncbi:hypothetical protein ACFYWH_39640 [Streptomyces sp. NPDC003737]|uniref:hypothetical protein n=1 Tax=Streptomyces sp. NPDC003737 TaxID=3364685 RepID=UPI0036BB1401